MIGVLLEKDKMQNWWWNPMPDKIVIKPSDGSIIFTNAAGAAIGSIDTSAGGDVDAGTTDEITINKAKLTNGNVSGGTF